MQKRWLIESGNIREIVEALTAEDAMAKVFTMFDDEDEPPDPGAIISAIEVVGEELYQSTEAALRASGRLDPVSVP